MYFASSDRGETHESAFVTAYDIEKARNKQGEKELTAHFENKKGFDNMGFDGKSSQTKQKDGTLKVKSNVTCVSDGTFLEYFQPPDGSDPTYGEELHKVVKKYEAEKNLIYIEADSTAVNTGMGFFLVIFRWGHHRKKVFPQKGHFFPQRTDYKEYPSSN